MFAELWEKAKSTPCSHPCSVLTWSWGQAPALLQQDHAAFSRDYSPALIWLHPTLGPSGWTRKELFVLLQTSMHKQNPRQGCDLPGAASPDFPGSPGCSRSPLRCHQNPRGCRRSQLSAPTWSHTMKGPFTSFPCKTFSNQTVPLLTHSW